MADPKPIANAIAQENDADIILINASMERGYETKFIDRCGKECARTNAIVIIVTNGGDADVAYRIARCLQLRYEKITAVISGMCKSAGTLLAIGAHELAFSEHGELGPLDVQLRKSDDIWANVSGLTVMNAFTALQQKSEEAFTDFALRIKARSGGSVTFKMAADIAQKLTVGLFSHIYQQVEVMHVGEAARAMKIAEEYGKRLDMVSDNLRPGSALSKLIAGYPSHEFVIDMLEAGTLFRNVRELTANEIKLCTALGSRARQQDDRVDPVQFLSDAPAPAAETKDDDTKQTDNAGAAGEEPGTEGAAQQAAPAAQAAQPAAVVQFPGAQGARGA